MRHLTVREEDKEKIQRIGQAVDALIEQHEKGQITQEVLDQQTTVLLEQEGITQEKLAETLLVYKLICPIPLSKDDGTDPIHSK